jgi:hypothetical protein
MASCGPERCHYCGCAPCIGEDCPSNYRDLVTGEYLDDDLDWSEPDDYEEEDDPHDSY